MKYEDIQTFLAVIDAGNIAKAADELYISQGTASTRIKQLEQELGISLFHRQKGHRKIFLTTQGEEFLPMAQQWSAIWQDALNLKHMETFQKFKVAATDMINVHTFFSLYQHMIEIHPEILLSIKTHHSSEIHRLVDNQQCDIGFCINLYNYPNIISTPLYEEKMVLLTHKNHPYIKNHKISYLQSSLEIHLSSSSAFEHWHSQYFKNQNRKLIETGTVTMQLQFMITPNCWSIVPMSSAVEFINSHSDYIISEFEKQPPKRTIYLLTYKYPRSGVKAITNLFIDELLKFIKENKSLNVIYKK